LGTVERDVEADPAQPPLEAGARLLAPDRVDAARGERLPDLLAEGDAVERMRVAARALVGTEIEVDDDGVEGLRASRRADGVCHVADHDLDAGIGGSARRERGCFSTAPSSDGLV